jgi:uncharacterized protein (TIGR03000 family)
MFRKALSIGGMFLVVGAVVLATPSLGQAQRGGHGGGGRSGGVHLGGAGGGGYHAGTNYGGYHAGTNYGGYRGGIYHGGANYGGYRYGSPYVHHGSYGYTSPYYGSYGYTSPYYGAYPYAASSPTYNSGYSGLYSDQAANYAGDTTAVAPSTGSYQAFYSPTLVATPSDPLAHVTVKVPADADIWIEDTATTSTGPVREFDSPPLTPGSRYSYEVRARWNENGHEVTQTQHLEVTAGAHVSVSFPVAPKTAAQVSVGQKD